MRTVTNEERRARLGARHVLASRVDDPIEATRAMVALHSSDPATVYLSIRARVDGFETTDLEQALYEDRSLFRIWGMRRTLWVVEPELVALIHHSSTKPIGERDRKRTAKILEDGGITDDGLRWLETMEPRVLGALRDRGEVLTRDLTRDLEGLDGKLEFYNKAGKLMGTSGLTSRVLVQLGLESRAIRTRPTGTWISGQYRWADFEAWLGSPIDDMSEQKASIELVTRWLHAFGPATETDLRWWTGWNVGQLRSALDEIDITEVELESGLGLLLGDDVDEVGAPGPWVALLPSLDPTTMGWKERDWYVGRHSDVLFDRNGNAGPTVWVDGRIVGGWAQRKDGTVVYELLEDVPKTRESEIEQEAASVQDWLGDIVVTPRFRSPLDKKLAP